MQQLSDGSFGTRVELATVAKAIPVDVQAHKFDKLDILVSQSVAAGADYMATSTFDFSQYFLVQYSYSTTSAGSGTTNSFLYAVEGSSFRAGIKTNIPSNDVAFRAITTPTDVRGFDTLSIGFRNGDIQPITVSLKAYCQY